MQLIPLEAWAEQRYPLAKPKIDTLRRWAREGRIQPPPEKHGRSYFVQPSAEYLTQERLMDRLNGPSSP
jgi:predicted site-specific integrase-resolvase